MQSFLCLHGSEENNPSYPYSSHSGLQYGRTQHHCVPPTWLSNYMGSFPSVESQKSGNIFNLSLHLIFRVIIVFELWHFEALHLIAYGLWVSIMSFWIFFLFFSIE